MNFKTLRLAPISLVTALFVISLFSIVLVTSATLANAATTVYAPAVDNQGKGIITPFIVTAQPGTGKIRTDIKGSLLTPETEDSIRTAARAASVLSKVNINNIDINVDIDSEAQVIDGPSGGVAFAVAIYNELLHLANSSAPNIRTDMTITGAIGEEGTTEKVGGVEEKLIGANQTQKIKLMIIASGQSNNDGIDYVLFAREISGGKLQVVEVPTLETALKYAYTETGSTVDAPEFAIKPLVLIPFTATQKTEHFKQIAFEEIENVQSELTKLEAKLVVEQNGVQDSNNQVKAVLRAVNISIKNAKEAANKGYYYTAANSAFLAKITLQTVNAEGTTPADFSNMVSNLQTEITTYNRTIPINDKNYEQVAAAQLRYWWAATRLEEVKAEFANTHAVSISNLRSYYNAKAWFDASKKLFQYSKGINGNSINEFNAREYSLDLLVQSQEIANQSTDTEIQWHLRTAKHEIANGDYVAAAFDLQFVLSADRFAFITSTKSPQIITSEIEKIKTENIYANADESPWAELYYGNALFNMQEANRSSDLSSLASALRLTKLAEGFQTARQTLNAEFLNPRPTKNRTVDLNTTLPLTSTPSQQTEPVVSTVITTTANQNAGILQVIAISIIGIGIITLIVALFSKIKSKPPLSRLELADKLDEALISGRISEATYNKLRQKYKQGKEKISTLKNQKSAKIETSRERLQKRRR